MSEAQPACVLAAGPAAASDPGLTLATLGACGAAAFDPVGFCFIEALARRMAMQPGNVQQLLAGPLARQLALFEARLDLAAGLDLAEADADAGATLDRAVAQHPAAVDRWRQRHAGDDLKRPARLAAALGPPGAASPLAELVHANFLFLASADVPSSASLAARACRCCLTMYRSR